MLTGNKGEWSEIYVMLRLLSAGKIHAADEDIKKIENIYFPILKIIREEIINCKYEYKIADKVQVFMNDNFVCEIDRTVFENEADYLYNKILLGETGAFSIEKTQKFISEIGCTRLAAPSSDKTDITMQIHDIQTGYNPICGFSIKSEIGNPPTLINAASATNFIFEVKGLTSIQIDEINSINTKTKIIDRMNRIFTDAEEVSFCGINSDTFKRNLMLIDSRLPELAAHTLICHYRDGITSCKDIVEKMETENPMGYPSKDFYVYKFKKLLCSAALGMTPARMWDGIDEANGGYIIVTINGDVLAYHIYNRAYFETYLLNNTKFERASTSRHNYASLYRKDGKVYVNLNLQIRFIK